jgi:hypothetical protein
MEDIDGQSAGKVRIPSTKGNGRAIAGFVISILAASGFFFPVAGIALSGTSLIVSLSATKSQRKPFAVAGLAISIFFLIFITHSGSIGNGFDPF